MKTFNIPILEITSISVFTAILCIASILLVFRSGAKNKAWLLLTIAFFSNPVWIGKLKSGLFSQGPYVTQSYFIGTLVFFVLILALQFNKKVKQTVGCITLNDLSLLAWCLIMFLVSIYAWIAGGVYYYCYSMLGVILFLFVAKTALVSIPFKDLLDGVEKFALLYFSMCWIYSIVYLDYHAGISGGRLQTLTKGTEDIGVYASIFMIMVLAFRDWTRFGRSQLVVITGFITLLASGNRASLLLFLVSFFVIYLVRIRHGNIFIKITAFVVLIVLVFSGSAYRHKSSYGEAKKISYMSAIDRLKGDGASLSSSNRMTTIWPMYIKAIQKNPFGNKGYPTSYDMPSRAYPHNLLLFVTYGGGIVAGIFFVVWLIFFSTTLLLYSKNVLIAFSIILTFVGNLMKFDPIRTPNEFVFFIAVSMICVRIVYGYHQSTLSQDSSVRLR
jgi:hypothetical protein